MVAFFFLLYGAIFENAKTKKPDYPTQSIFPIEFHVIAPVNAGRRPTSKGERWVPQKESATAPRRDVNKKRPGRAGPNGSFEEDIPRIGIIA